MSKSFGLGSISGHTSNRVSKMSSSRRAKWANGRRRSALLSLFKKRNK